MGNPPGNPNQDARNKTGRYIRTPETIARDAEAARLYCEERWTYQEIADHFEWSDKKTAYSAVERALRDVAAPAKPARDRRDRELQLLWDSAMEILENHHVVVSNGKVIELDGVPLRDDGPRLNAIDQLRKINESRRKLDGVDAPSRLSIDAQQLGDEILALLDRAAGGTDGDTDG